jgi:hypothetical protein
MASLIFRTQLHPSIRKNVRREVEIDADATLADLACAVVEAYGFVCDHAFGFYNADVGFYKDSVEVYELFADDPDYRKDHPERQGCEATRIVEAFPEDGKRMQMLFDYGDEWLFLVERVGSGNATDGTPLPRVVGSVGRAPKQYR